MREGRSGCLRTDIEREAKERKILHVPRWEEESITERRMIPYEKQFEAYIGKEKD